MFNNNSEERSNFLLPVGWIAIASHVSTVVSRQAIPSRRPLITPSIESGCLSSDCNLGMRFNNLPLYSSYLFSVFSVICHHCLLFCQKFKNTHQEVFESYPLNSYTPINVLTSLTVAFTAHPT